MIAPFVPIRWLGAGLHLANSLLLAGTVAAGWRAVTAGPLAPASAALLSPVASTPAPTLDLVDLAAVVERGLFGRLPAEPEAARPGSGDGRHDAPSAPPPALVGTAVTSTGAAAVFDDGGGQILVAVGEPINDEWRLVAVRRGRAVVEDSAGRRTETPLPLVH